MSAVAADAVFLAADTIDVLSAAQPADVWVEAFGCDPAAEWMAWLARRVAEGHEINALENVISFDRCCPSHSLP